MNTAQVSDRQLKGGVVHVRLVMMGTGTFAEPTFEALFATGHTVAGLVTQPDRVIGQERGSTRQVGRGLKSIASEHGIDIVQPESVNTPEGIAAIKAWQPDLLVVAAYGQILAREVLEAVPRGGINVHASLLPKYRGAAPVAWAIYHGEVRTGVTIIRVSTALDAGEILAQESLDIDPDETAGELEARLAPLGARLAVEVLDQFAAGSLQGKKQDPTLATKAPKLTKERGVIDWSRTARDVCNQARAMQPWPTAYTFLHRIGQAPVRVIVHRCRCATAGENPSMLPGQIVLPPTGSPNGLIVSAGGGTAVEITELQPAGKRRMSATDFLRGYRLQLGDVFGPESA